MPVIGLYCSASDNIEPLYKEEAIQLASWIGRQGWTLMNGGSSQGLMNLFSETVHQSGGTCLGVIPTSFRANGWISPFNDEIIWVNNLSERKETIKANSDVILVFPGGIGTLDEMFDAWASYSLGFHHNPVVLCNLHDFYSPLLSFLEKLKKDGFIHSFLPDPLNVVDSIEAGVDWLEKWAKASKK